MKNKLSHQISFWELLKSYEIEIPIIQRDYAQGRLGKEYLRKSFLSNLKDALDTNKVLILDFVYGSTENGMFNPLDGQQRLTTLWLLHWYIALHAGVLNKNNCAILSKFTYKTRISSREFCESLRKPQNFKCFNGDNIVGFITKQTWFYSAWKQDPTIQSMLRMLGGTKIADKNGEDIVDGFEELFWETKKEDYEQYWQELTEKEKIVFYNLLLDDFGLSDDLYIKMNARGKQLTAFENFKADLIGYIRKQAEEAIGNTKSDWSMLLDSESGIPKLMDTTWTDIFWKYKSKDNNRIDEIFFAFLNRFFLNELVCQKNKDEFFYTAKQLEDNSVFSYLYGNESNDTSIEYVGFEKYKDIPLTFLNNLINTLKNIPSDIKLSDYHPGWVGQEFQYIPIYDEGSISSLKQRDRIAFHAISKYIQMGVFDDVSFRQWMRVVWNIVENAGVNSISSMVGVMRLIDELSGHSHKIYDYLVYHSTEIKSNAAQEQVIEEIAKAKHILNKTLTEKEIEDVEAHPLLKGCISVLFEDDTCNKVSHKQTLQERFALLDSLYNEHDMNDYTLIKVLIPFFTGSITDKKTFILKKNQSNWKTLVTTRLKDCFRQLKTKDDRAECTFEWQRMLSDTNLLENSRNDGKILGCYENHVVLWATNGCTWNAYDNVILDNLHHNLLLSKLVNKKIISCKQKVNEQVDFFWGWDIDFVYNYQNGQYYFRWFAYPDEYQLDIYLMKDNWDYMERRPNHTNDKTEEDGRFCFRVDSNETCESFIRKLDCLITQAYPESEEKIQCVENSRHNNGTVPSETAGAP